MSSLKYKGKRKPAEMLQQARKPLKTLHANFAGNQGRMRKGRPGKELAGPERRNAKCPTETDEPNLQHAENTALPPAFATSPKTPVLSWGYGDHSRIQHRTRFTP